MTTRRWPTRFALVVAVVALLVGSCADECDQYEYESIGGSIAFYGDWMEVTDVEAVSPEQVDLSAQERRNLEMFRSSEAQMLRGLSGHVLRGESFERGLAQESVADGARRGLERGGSLALGHEDGRIAGVVLEADGTIEWLGACSGSATDQLSDFAAHLAETSADFADADPVDVVRALVSEGPDGPLSRQFDEWLHPSPTQEP